MSALVSVTHFCEPELWLGWNGTVVLPEHLGWKVTVAVAAACQLGRRGCRLRGGHGWERESWPD